MSHHGDDEGNVPTTREGPRQLYKDGGKVENPLGGVDPNDQKLGGTGQYPLGKMNPNDEGQIAFRVGHNKEQAKVVIDFGKPVAWMAMTPNEAYGLSKMLRKHAKRCQGR